jgi:hypothetical protein
MNTQSDEWQTFQGYRPRTPPSADPRVTIRKDGTLTLNPAAWAALGQPDSVSFIYSTQRPAIGIRAAQPDDRFTAAVRKTPGIAREIRVRALLRFIGYPIGESRILVPQIAGTPDRPLLILEWGSGE